MKWSCAPPQAKLLGQTDGTSPVCQAFAVDDLGSQSGQRPLGGVWESIEQDFAGAQAEHRVTKELEALIVQVLADLVGVAWMGQSLTQVWGIGRQDEKGCGRGAHRA